MATEKNSKDKMKILFIDGDDSEREIYRIYLENMIFDYTLLLASNFKTALRHLNNDQFALIICANNMEDGTSGEVYSHLKELSPQTIFVHFGQTTPENISGLEGFQSHNSKNTYIPLPISPMKFREQILNILRPACINLEPIPAFQKIRLSHFLRFNKVLCNVYLQLSPRKYVKVINANSIYTKDLIDKYRLRGVNHLYIANNDFEKFEITQTKSSFLIMDAESMTSEELAKALISTHIIMQDIALDLGFNSEVIELAQRSVDEIIKLVDGNPNIIEIFNRLRLKMDYIYDHSYLLCIACCEILKQTGKCSPQKIQNLCMAALFHDITLTNPNLAMIQDANSEELKKFSQEEIKQYLRHPFDSADLLSDNEQIVPEIREIIRQHHENIEGNGFPNRLHPSKLSLYVCIFIVAHDYVSQMYAYNFDTAFTQTVLDNLLAKYDSGHFKTVTNTFCREFRKAS